jgi:hypothetical protein
MGSSIPRSGVRRVVLPDWRGPIRTTTIKMETNRFDFHANAPCPEGTLEP